MAIEWSTEPLDRLVDPQRAISYGIVQPGAPTCDGVPIIRVTDIRDGRISTAEPLRVSRDIEAAYSRTRLRGGELLLTLVGTVGEAAVVPSSLVGWNTARAVAVIPVRADVGSYWVSLALRSPEVRHIIDSRLNTTVQATLNLRDVAQLPIVMPPEAERRAIAHIVGTLDDKIELNRRMSETLETMAQALFKSWFVNFDPVRARAEGREGGVPKSLADPFPTALITGEFCDIPGGWRVGSVYDVADVIYGAPFSSSLFNSVGVGEPLIRIRDLANESPGVWTPEVHPKGYKVRAGDIVVGMDGEFRAYLWGGAEGWLNQRICVFKPKPGWSAAFVRNAIVGPLAHVEATETATTVIHLGKADIDLFKIVLPHPHVARLFNRTCQPWYDRIVRCKRESRTLAVLRDTLLPKLISGELQLKDADKFVEKVA